MPPIWVVNLRRSHERRERIMAHLDDLGLNYELIEAVDGRELSPQELAASYSSAEAIAHMGRELTPGEIGCSLSHLRLYQRQIDLGLDEVVVLEDDALINPAFLKIMDARHLFPVGWELVLFGRGDTRVSYWGSQTLDRQHRCVKFASVAYMAIGYVLRQTGARKLLEHALPIRVPADHLTGGQIRTGVCLYGIDPPCVLERCPGAAHSTMAENYVGRKPWPTRHDFPPLGWLKHKARFALIHFFEKCNPFGIV